MQDKSLYFLFIEKEKKGRERQKTVKREERIDNKGKILMFS